MKKIKTTRPFRSRIFIVLTILVASYSAAENVETALGSPDAPVTIIEYGSLTCGYCIKFHKEVMPLIKSRHIDSGHVRFIFRDFPTSKKAIRGAVAARCAGDQYYEILELLFENVGSWFRASKPDSEMIELAITIGLDDERFKACLSDPKNTEAVKEAQRQSTEEYGVIATPTFLINNNVVNGFQDINQMEMIIEHTLEITRKNNSDNNETP
ncbi:DsbA family protein [Marinicella rhabdoformis]|uniref:DsbA family protein n=1 Tax=Marinicella rhabdoformis TaxID=2580566 RepID=UPI0012AECDBD|nr:DsbA family protein [Marinicella rhabdoformis]